MSSRRRTIFQIAAEASESTAAGNRQHRGLDAVAVIAILIAGLLAYSNSLDGPFVLDDRVSIEENPTIRNLGDLREVLWSPPRSGATTDGRPLLNLSLAINYAIHGLELRGYHLFNLALHLTNAVLVWLVMREVLAAARIPDRFRQQARAIAFAVALLWVVHPLTTAAVTYIIQRAEALLALYYLLAAFCFLRGCRVPRGRPWLAAAAAVCFIGQGSKEIMATAPLALLLLDVACVSGSFRAALAARKWWHALNFASLVPAILLIARNGGRSGTVGINDEAGRLTYLAAQGGHILNYLRLCVWPTHQVFDYGTELAPLSVAQLPQVLAVAGLGIAALWLFFRRSLLGLPGVLLFLILAPTSSLVPINTQVAAEHRMYLPLVLVLAAIVFAGSALLAQIADRRSDSAAVTNVSRQTVAAAAMLAVVLGMLTLARNEVYQSKVALWADTVAKRPTNLRACETLALELLAINQGQYAPAVFDAAIAGPNPAEALSSRAEILVHCGREDLATNDLQDAIQRDPHCDRAWSNLGVLVLNRGQFAEAEAHFRRALELRPNNAIALRNRGNLRVLQSRLDEARSDYETSLACLPDKAETIYALARLDHLERNLPAAAEGYRLALYCNPNHAESQQGLAEVLAELAAAPSASR